LGALKQASPLIKQLGKQDYEKVWQAMQHFTQSRNIHTPDELWVVEHPPVFTLGRNGKESHILNKSDIPIIKVDRGGQVTYHGPGQLVIYFLLDLHRRKLGIRQLVTLIEDCLVTLLSRYNIEAYSDIKAPGVYVDKQKIAALGLRVSKGCTTHGLSLNIDMDLSPFKDINPCGYENLKITQCKNLGIEDNHQVLTVKLINLIEKSLEIALEA
jgi:lipoyl(octanoyl) transferase